jgi:hypothetical protein
MNRYLNSVGYVDDWLSNLIDILEEKATDVRVVIGSDTAVVGEGKAVISSHDKQGLIGNSLFL